MIKDGDRAARVRYRKKIQRLEVELYPTDQDIKDHLAALDKPRATYIKQLIRADIALKCAGYRMPHKGGAGRG